MVRPGIVCILLGLWGCTVSEQKPSPAPQPAVKTGAEKTVLPETIISAKDESPMVLIPAGEFTFGVTPRKREELLRTLENAQLEIFDSEFPEQTRSTRAYYIDKFEVTNRRYARFLEDTGHRKPRYWSLRLYNEPDQPVVGVGWSDAEAFAKWAGKRLPTEEEWEKAARGTDGRIWPWGNEPSGEKYNGKSQGNFKPVAVGSFPMGASPYGVMDMAGNVYEMTTGVWSNLGKAMRGGSYLNAGAYTRTMFRWSTAEEANGAEYLGFRCVVDTDSVSTISK